MAVIRLQATIRDNPMQSMANDASCPTLASRENPCSPAVNDGLVIPPYTNGYVGSATDIRALELGLPVFVSGANTKLVPADPSPVFT
jgi:hypothetical protein